MKVPGGGQRTSGCILPFPCHQGYSSHYCLINLRPSFTPHSSHPLLKQTLAQEAGAIPNAHSSMSLSFVQVLRKEAGRRCETGRTVKWEGCLLHSGGPPQSQVMFLQAS